MSEGQVERMLQVEPAIRNDHQAMADEIVSLRQRVAQLEAEVERGWAMARSYYKDREEAWEAAENYFLAWEDSRTYWKDKVARLKAEVERMRGETGERE